MQLIAHADGKMDAIESRMMYRILDEETHDIDPSFPAQWEKNSEDIKQWGKTFSEEVDEVEGNARKQFEWMFGLLDGYWKILNTMPYDLRWSFKKFILKSSIRIADATGEGSDGMGRRVGVRESTVIQLVCESLDIPVSGEELAGRLGGGSTVGS